MSNSLQQISHEENVKIKFNVKRKRMHLLGHTKYIQANTHTATRGEIGIEREIFFLNIISGTSVFKKVHKAL